MIKNEREYRITKAQAEEFARSLAALDDAPVDQRLHPRMRQAQREAIQSQLEELRLELADYESLRSGKRTIIELTSLEDLPEALIKARIAAGLNQRELADRLKISEQQIQRYEASGYRTASFARLMEVAQALGIQMREEVYLPNVEVSERTFVSRLTRAGLDQNFIEQRLLGHETSDENYSADALKGATAAQRVFGWRPTEVFAATNILPPPPSEAVATFFKLPARAQQNRTLLLAAYARYIARLGLMATEGLSPKPIPDDAQAFREQLLKSYGKVNLATTLHLLWDLGVVVIPLKDGGGFHAACWRIEGRNAIILKQCTYSESRWLHDLLHEVRHAAEEPHAKSFELIDSETMPAERRKAPEEIRASRFAGNVIFDGEAERLAKECRNEAGGKLERLKTAVPRVAKRNGVDTGALANYMAWRLSLQGENWWGAAANLQRTDDEPWRVTRDFLIPRLDWSKLDALDRGLLANALSED